jgi:predicted  nucleic acid-binding Zn-ribbon protein
MPCGSANTKDMKKKARVIVVEYATLKEEYLAEKGTLDGYEEMMARMEQQLREIAAKRTRPDGTVEPLRDPEPMVVQEVVEYETAEERYFAEKGTMEGFEESIARMEQQLREIVARRTRQDGTVEPLYEADPTWRKKSRKK